MISTICGRMMGKVPNGWFRPMGQYYTGTELIRRLGRGSAHALTTLLIKKADGTKFDKSRGNVWLDLKNFALCLLSILVECLRR